MPPQLAQTLPTLLSLPLLPPLLMVRTSSIPPLAPLLLRASGPHGHRWGVSWDRCRFHFSRGSDAVTTITGCNCPNALRKLVRVEAAFAQQSSHTRLQRLYALANERQSMVASMADDWFAHDCCCCCRLCCCRSHFLCSLPPPNPAPV